MNTHAVRAVSPTGLLESVARSLREHPSGVSFRYESDRNARDFFQRLNIHYRDVICHGIGYVGRLAVRRKSHPGGTLPAEFGSSQQFQIGERVCVEEIVYPA